MRDFFNGWRRKLGVVTLVIALVFMCGWLRCFVVDDLTLIDFDEWELTTPDQSLCVYRYDFDTVQSQLSGTFPMTIGLEPAPQATAGIQAPVPIGIDFSFAVEPVRVVAVPFWAIVLPLTLLSAWLILLTPKTQQKVDQAVATAMA